MADEGRTETLRFRVTAEEKAAIEAEAERLNMSVSDLVRRRVLIGSKATKRPAPSPEDRDFIERRAKQLEGEGLPAHNARILAARERNRTGPRIGLPERYRPSEAKQRQLMALREAFAKQFGGDAA